MKRIFLIAMIVLLVVLAAGCSTPTATQAPAASSEIPTAIPLDKGKGGLAGQVTDASTRWSGEPVMAFAAPFTAVNDNEEGFYVLEPDVHPHTTVDSNGRFQIGAVEPGAYVIVVGPTARDGKLAMNSNGKPQVFQVKAGEILQIGTLTLAQ